MQTKAYGYISMENNLLSHPSGEFGMRKLCLRPEAEFLDTKYVGAGGGPPLHQEN
jgi:hypothetical protein